MSYGSGILDIIQESFSLLIYDKKDSVVGVSVYMIFARVCIRACFFKVGYI